ncbi:class I SAM-dependent methyltransferase [Candidatus Omnitrophota bacterium]
MKSWYEACNQAATLIYKTVPDHYRSRTFSGIIGDIKALPPQKAQSLFNRKKGLGKQYAWLYLTKGIDEGKGYQACASEALASVLGPNRDDILRGTVLDVGCAVGVTSGILTLDRVTGFDLFPDVLAAARLVDSFTGRKNEYVVSDMTRTWPFGCVFDTVVCGLVCHHLKEQRDVVTFFSNMNRVLLPGSSVVITLPAGSVGTSKQFEMIAQALGHFGFRIDMKLTGMVCSTDYPNSLFWMFVITAKKISDVCGCEFISPDFGFHLYRTQETRVEKGKKARSTATVQRKVKHELFKLTDLDEMLECYGEKNLVYEEHIRM